MKKIVFNSSQSDLSKGTNRSLIERALKDAAKEIEKDADTDIEPVIDRDTQGMAGAVNIAAAIFQKIDSADIFVADVSIIGSVKKRSLPNPNVLVELGYALKSRGHERIILVFNTAFGKVEKLPFDLRMHKVLTYQCPESLQDRSEVKKNLTKDLKSALLAGFSHVTPIKPAISIIDIIKNNAPSKKIELRAYLTNVLKELEGLRPPMKREGGTVDGMLAAFPKTEYISVEFSKLSETVALMDDSDSAKEIFQWFGKILSKYDAIPAGGGTSWNCDGDFYKFIGHELFVDFINPFVREGKWKELKELLSGTLLVSSVKYGPNGSKDSWTELSEHSPWLVDESKKKGRISCHADLLKDRHEKSELAGIVPLNEFTETDFFLHLYGDKGRKSQEIYYGAWYPRSDVYLNHTPRFVLEATDYPTAMQICLALQIGDVEELKGRLSRLQLQWSHFPPINEKNINEIGSEGGVKIIK